MSAVLQGGQAFIEDLDSVNHTYVNRQRLQPNVPQPLNPGDEIRLGKVVLRYAPKVRTIFPCLAKCVMIRKFTALQDSVLKAFYLPRCAVKYWRHKF